MTSVRISGFSSDLLVNIACLLPSESVYGVLEEDHQVLLLFGQHIDVFAAFGFRVAHGQLL